MQRDVTTTFEIEDSIMSGLQATLPGRSQNGYINADRGSNGVLSSKEEFYDWFGMHIVDKVYRDELCGNGLCEAQEYAGFGRFGCIKDCGRYLNTTRIYVNVNDFESEVQKFWPSLTLTQNNFRYNIWSETMQDFLLKEDATTSTNMEAPDGLFELRLYQAESVSDIVDESSISQAFRVASGGKGGKLPTRATNISDYRYGDAREILSTATRNLLYVDEYCTFNSALPAAAQDEYCATKYSLRDFEIRTLGMYGLQGRIFFKNGSTGISNLTQLSFCGLSPSTAHLGRSHRPNIESYGALAAQCSQRRTSGGDAPLRLGGRRSLHGLEQRGGRDDAPADADRQGQDEGRDEGEDDLIRADKSWAGDRGHADRIDERAGRGGGLMVEAEGAGVGAGHQRGAEGQGVLRGEVEMLDLEQGRGREEYGLPASDVPEIGLGTVVGDVGRGQSAAASKEALVKEGGVNQGGRKDVVMERDSVRMVEPGDDSKRRNEYVEEAEKALRRLGLSKGRSSGSEAAHFEGRRGWRDPVRASRLLVKRRGGLRGGFGRRSVLSPPALGLKPTQADVVLTGRAGIIQVTNETFLSRSIPVPPPHPGDALNPKPSSFEVNSRSTTPSFLLHPLLPGPTQPSIPSSLKTINHSIRSFRGNAVPPKFGGILNPKP